MIIQPNFYSMERFTLFKINQQNLEIKAYIKGLHPTQYRQEVQVGKWTIHDQLAHLARYQEIFEWRIQRISETEEPRFERYRAEEDAEFTTWQAKDTFEIMKEMSDHRKEMLLFLTELDTSDLERRGKHPRYGMMTVLQWIHFFLLHESHHHFEIFKMARVLQSQEES